MSKVLLISADVVDVHMGGVGVRNWELSRALARRHEVTLAAPNETSLHANDFSPISFDLVKGDLKAVAHAQDVIILHGPVLHFHPYLQQLGVPLAIDLYVPSLLESLVWHDRDNWENWIPAYEEYLRVQLELLRAGDFFFCASDRQRDYWLGWLHAQKRINPHTYRQDETFRKLIDVVPFGLPDDPPPKKKPVLKGVHPGISPADRLILWAGGLWDWLDPLTLIRSMARLTPHNPEFKLYFMGTRHPNPLVSGMTMPDQAITLSKELGLYNKTIFFGDWVPYDQRANCLVEADLAVVSHQEHIETHFSFRTRLLDCIWAGLPVVATDGDALAELIKKNKIGVIVPPGDEKALAAAIENILTESDRTAYTPAFERLQKTLRWEKVIEPLDRFCANPSTSPDKEQYLTEVERIGQAKDAFLEQVIREKDAFLEQVMHDNEILRTSLSRYHRLPPVRVYHWTKRLLKKE